MAAFLLMAVLFNQRNSPVISGSANSGPMVVGNVGLNSMAGRLLGSVPSEVSRRVKTDVLIVHTAD